MISVRRLISVLLCLSAFAFAQPADEANVEDLVGRLLLLAFEGDVAPLERLSEFSPAGFLYYPSNVTSTEAVRRSTRTLQDVADYPLLFGVDQEGGPFTTYRVDDATVFPGNMALAATGEPELARQVGAAVGEELAYAGFNLNFAPVVDVNSNPDNPIIGVRSFGADPAAVARLGVAYLEGLDAAGVAGVAKHFPGHGDTDVDSHLGLPSVTGERTRLDTVELTPFRALIEADIPGVMTAHVVFPALEPSVPATLSSAALTDLLKDDLGFGGMVVTDFMDMQAITDNYGAGEAAVRSVVAGADLVLLGSDLQTQRQVVTALREAVSSGRLSEVRVRDAVAQTEAVAAAYRPAWDAALPNYNANQALAVEVATAGATLLRNEGALPLEPNARTVVIAPQPDLFGEAPHLGSVLARHHADVESVVIGEDPTEADIASAVAATSGVDQVILGSYHWLGGFPEGLNTLASQLEATGLPLTLVALGNPDDIRFMGVEVDAYLAVYGYREANLEAAARVLTGQAEARGHLPVSVGERYPLGAGVGVE